MAQLSPPHSRMASACCAQHVHRLAGEAGEDLVDAGLHIDRAELRRDVGASPSRALERAVEWLKPGGVIQAEVPSSRWLISRLVNAYYRLCGTLLVTNISPMHVPFHLFEFSPRSFQLHGRRAGYDIAEQRFMVCSIPHVPGFLHPPLRWWMGRSGTGMQLEVYLRKSEAGRN